MNHTMTDRPPRTRTMWIAMPWLLAIALAGVVVRRSTAPDGALLVASIYAILWVVTWLAART